MMVLVTPLIVYFMFKVAMFGFLFFLEKFSDLFIMGAKGAYTLMVGIREFVKEKQKANN